ncbi:MAG: TatD family hydrolase [Chloroflexota bacterium]|nr:TatD family hydrolase [Chloroflexota bacterium]
MRLVDTHSHIHDAEFARDRADADAAIERARAAGVTLIATLGVDRADSEAAVAFAERHPDAVVAAAGVHPHAAKDASDVDLDALEALARHPRVALVGEIGMDLYRNLSPRDQQLRVLRRQLDTARRVSKPIAVHAREAHDEVMPVLAAWSHEMGGRLPDGRPLGVLHYFSADAGRARTYVALGFVISVHTSVTHPKATQLAGVVRDTPLEHLVLETDSPYGAPQRYRGTRNEPAYVAEAAARVAEIKCISIEEVAETTTRNAERLLGAGTMYESTALQTARHARD